jgi:hypothetical protein
MNVFRTQMSFWGFRPCGLDAPIGFLLNQPSENEFVNVGQKLIEEAFRQFWPVECAQKELVFDQTCSSLESYPKYAGA